MRLLIVEKPSRFQKLADLGLLPDDTEVVFTQGMGLWQFSLPRLSFNDIPYSQQPTKLRPKQTPLKKLLITKEGETLVSVPDNPSRVDLTNQLQQLINYLNNNLVNYEEIICLVDPDRTGYGGANQLLQNLSINQLPPVHCLYLSSYTRANINKAWENRSQSVWDDNSKANKLAKQQRVKDIFDYWWNSNASIVFSELCNWSGLKGDPIVSKYELMLLAVFSEENRRMNVHDVLETMSNWKGTGKYPVDRLTKGFGTASSRYPILKNAINRGAFVLSEVNNQEVIALSSEGNAFVAGLHNKTFDPDLPFRLNEWINTEDYASMERYIRTIFGRQFRHQRKHKQALYS